MQIIALTGGIASGKSTASRRLAQHGAAVIDADVLAREAVEPGTGALAAIVMAFGSGILNEDGSLNRAALAEIVFSDEEARLKLNAITHPAVWQLASQRITDAEREGRTVVVYDVPLLAEAAANRPLQFDQVIVVTAPLKERVRRMVEGRGMTPEQAEARLAAQTSDAERVRMADVVLDNSGTPEQLVAQVDAYWERFTR